MPELPEVQTTVNGINKYVKGLSIKEIWTSYGSDYHKGKDNIKDRKFLEKFIKGVLNKKIIKATRRAKNILIELSSGGVILIHLKMTGHLLYGDYEFKKEDKKDPWKGLSPKGLRDPFNRHIRLVFTLSSGKHLALSDMRRFAKVTYIEKGEVDNTPHLKDTGPEPLENSFDLNQFKEMLSRKPRGKIKQVLMNPSVIAGIGNIYSDEILWRSKIHPERKVMDIKAKEFENMFDAMKSTLKKGIDFGGDSMSDYRNILGEKGKFQEEHQAYRRTGKHCSMRGCSGTIIRKKVGGRSAHFCDTHQK